MRARRVKVNRLTRVKEWHDSDRREFPISSGFASNCAFRFLRSGGCEATFIALVLVTLSIFQPSSASADVPTNFTDTSVVTGLTNPTDIAFLPNGRMLITTQSGTLYSASGSTKSIAYNGLSLCSDFERGLLGVAVDPIFNSNAFIYLYYTFNQNGTCQYNTSLSPVNRVSRFTYNTGTNTVNGGSETVLVDNMPSPNGNHNAGDVGFGKDGYLYISIGDGGADLNNPNLQGGTNTNARKENILTGKILRITRDGGIPPTNPFQGSGTESCAATGRTTLTRCRETFAWGLRNPFRFAFDPNAAGTVLYVNDVGQGTWEEIDNIVAGADYGWNVREGHCANGSTSNCGAPPASMTNPIFDYQHGSCNSITAGTFVPAGIWPAAYDGAYLFADYTCGSIWRLSGGSRVDFLTSGPGPISMTFGPSGSTQALYYVTYDNGGEARKIQYNGTANQQPVARIVADKTFGSLPLTVNFDGTTSTDPDNDPLTYEWNFGDTGSPSNTSTASKPSHTYNAPAAKHTVSLTVRDLRGGVDTKNVVIDAGNTEPLPSISNPTSNAQFTVGQQITLTGSATDLEDGNLANSALSWTVIKHHDDHTHPFITNVVGNNIQIVAPEPEDLMAATNTYLEIRLTATDSNGLSKTISQNFLPKKVDLTLSTSPTGLKINVEGVDKTGPSTITSWAGWPIQVEALSPQAASSGDQYVFQSWSDAGAAAHTITTPSSPATYTATFRSASSPNYAPVADARVREASPNSNYGTSTVLQVNGGTTLDIESYLRFEVTGLTAPVTSAQLWIFANNGSVNGPAVYPAPNNWGESTITWNNRPIRSTSLIADRGAISNSVWVKYNVTSAVPGNGTYTFVLATNVTDGITANSREASTNRPKLVINADTSSGDNSPPSVPTNLTANAAAFNRVDLSWTESKDDVGVSGYDIYRNGQLLTTVGSVTTYADTLVSANTQYSYQARARDAAGNVSGLSNTEIVTTPKRTRTIVTEADSRVQEANPTSRYGTSTQLRTQGGSASDIETYLRFTVTGVSGSVDKATLRVFVPSSSAYGTTDGPAIYTAGNTWVESSITWNNRPPRSTTPHDDKGALPANTWAEFDVTDLVVGNGTLTFVLASTSTDYVVFSSKEGANPPQLVVEYDPNGAARSASVEEIPQPTPASEPTSTPTPGATSTPAATATASSNLPITDGFESGTLDNWTQVDGLTVQQSLVANGFWAARATSSGTKESPGLPSNAVRAIGSEQTDVYVRTLINVQSLGDNVATVLTAEKADGTPIATVLFSPRGNLALRRESENTVTEFDKIVPDRWHELQLHLAADGQQTLVEIWWDGELIYRQASPSSVTGVSAVRLGDESKTHSFDVAFDDFVIDKSCVGICSDNLRLPTPALSPTASPEQPIETPVSTEEPQPTPAEETQVSTETPEPTAEPATSTPEPTEIPPTEEPEPTATDANGA